MEELLKYLQNQHKQLATQISEVDLCPEGLSPVSIELLSLKLVLAGWHNTKDSDKG